MNEEGLSSRMIFSRGGFHLGSRLGLWYESFLPMPNYNDLRPVADLKKRDFALVFPGMTVTEKKRTIEGLLRLRTTLDAEVAGRRSESNLLIASWNIKELGHTTQRLPEAFFYLAEIIARLDLVIVQEIKSSMNDLEILMRLLGDDWSYVVNDITEGNAGNSERSAYLLNKTRVEFAGLAGEIVLWDDLTANSSIKQLKRTPFITGFRAGWKTFAIVNLHLHPGGDSEDVEHRREEVRLLLAAIRHKIKRGRFWNENLILAGDFNFFNGPHKDDETIAMLADAGFREVESLIGLDTNASRTEAYDRLFFSNNEYFRIVQTREGRENGGVFNPFRLVYGDGAESTYKAEMMADYTGSRDLNVPSKLASYYKHPWRKNQISDHFPIWCELIIDDSDQFLKEKLEDLEAESPGS